MPGAVVTRVVPRSPVWRQVCAPVVALAGPATSNAATKHTGTVPAAMSILRIRIDDSPL
jgi:hypothetical protein